MEVLMANSVFGRLERGTTTYTDKKTIFSMLVKVFITGVAIGMALVATIFGLDPSLFLK
jgi:hypothetical protein